MRQGIRKGWSIDIGQDIDMRDRDRERKRKRREKSRINILRCIVLHIRPERHPCFILA